MPWRQWVRRCARGLSINSLRHSPYSSPLNMNGRGACFSVRPGADFKEFAQSCNHSARLNRYKPMNLDQLSAFGQGVGGIAVAVLLICLGLRVRASTKASKVADLHCSMPGDQVWKSMVGEIEDSLAQGRPRGIALPNQRCRAD